MIFPLFNNQGAMHTPAAGGGGALDAAFLAGDIGVAYAMRLVNPSYTGDCLRIREDGGDTELDIGFDGNGDLDTAAAATHIGANNGYVVTWYDQGPNGHDLTGVSAAQPLYIASDSDFNSKPVLQWDGINDVLTCTGIPDTEFMNADEGTLLSVMNQNSAATNNADIWFQNGTDGNQIINTFYTFNNFMYFDFGGTGGDDRIFGAQPTGWDNTAHAVASWRTTGRVQEIEVDGVQIATKSSMTVSRSTSWTGDLYVGSSQAGSSDFQGEKTEIITALPYLGSTIIDAWRAEVDTYYGL